MLRSLLIEDFGLISKAEIQFATGATIFTGETGSGKTMVLGAIAFVLGERAGADVVRRASKRAAVTLTFEPAQRTREQLATDGFEIDADEDAVLQREMSEAGKSTLRLNGRQTTAGYVRELAAAVADIIGQHEAQRLLAPTYHTEILDRFGGPDVLKAKAAVRVTHEELERISGDLHALDEREGKAQAEVEFAQFAVEEILRIAPEADEETRLNERRHYLDNIERIASALKSAHDALTGESGATDALGTTSMAFHGIASIDRNLTEMAESARALQDEAMELAVRISRQMDETEFDSAELERINGRLDDLDLLKKKYGGTLQAVLESLDRYRLLVDGYATRDERRAELEAARGRIQTTLQAFANKLTALRTAAAKRLKKRVEQELPDLALRSAQFAPEIMTLASVGPDGAETVEFMFSANAGEPARPLAKVASGGELSRVLLALIVAVIETREPVALVFDEIDAGIGGATAVAVGARLARLQKATQVILVTHLAQIASWAQRHYVLEKHEQAGATTIAVREILKTDEKAGELARMLSGEARGVALKHAEALLQAASNLR